MIDDDVEAKSVYDGEDTAEDDLWFLPGEPEDRAPTDLPWPMANRAAIFDVKIWQRAEDEQGRGLAAASATFARLDERLRGAPEGLADRLALLEVADLLWAQGIRIPLERIALYRHLRESTLENARALSGADWALRRMLGRMQPTDGLNLFLGRQRVEEDSLVEISTRAVGVEAEGLEAEWLSVLDQLQAAHPITRAAALYHAWRAFGLSEPGGVLEGAVASAKIGAEGGKALGFLPIAMGDRYALGQGGSPQERLSGWYKAVENACLRGLMVLDQLEVWQRQAVRKTADLSGKTPPALIEVFVKSPIVSAEMAAKMTGASKAAAQRNLAKFEARGLIREITGQGRYRFWMVA